MLLFSESIKVQWKRPLIHPGTDCTGAEREAVTHGSSGVPCRDQ